MDSMCNVGSYQDRFNRLKAADLLTYKVKAAFLWLVENKHGIQDWKNAGDREGQLNCFKGASFFEAVFTIFKAQRDYDLAHPKESGHLAYGLPKSGELPRPKVLVQLVGFSLEPLMLTASVLKPEQCVILLYSKETKTDYKDPHACWLKEKGFNNIVDDDNCCVNSSDPAELFQRIKKLVTAVEPRVKPEEVAVDLSGGKKSMVAGAFLAGALAHYALYYVDFELYYKDTTPLPGTEFLSRLPNPYDIYNERELTEVGKLFESHNYGVAYELLRKVYKNCEKNARFLEDTGILEAYQRLDVAALTYEMWDLWRYEAAAQVPRRKQNRSHAKVLEKQHEDVLTVFRNKVPEDDRERFSQSNLVCHLVVDQFANALRRMKAHRYDDAVIRFVKVIEQLCYYRLYCQAEMNKVKRQDTGAAVTLDDLYATKPRWSVTRLLRSHFHDDNEFEVELLKEGDEFERVIVRADDPLEADKMGMTVGKMVQLIEERNLFVHGRTKKAQKTAQELEKLACAFLRFFFEAYWPTSSFDKLLNQHTFLTFDEIRGVG